ncbi:FAD/NAD(P)-binding domain-containing protein [Annulohypoxylon maeteangense]|uniref:FAD/NAD(P)-binding domain-containing protein n=1 Tax=Annulohypoxylon maeteangense TaxID=1927788 RepID=UPI0020083F3C|nr:FAD/NAD(P)-binding domain-containing protein [Annulohypoxylon maeteangense]KAI0886409.1 FAD/NAD(P)-binding domain-containing protein [Annulohypoxylon maeteangense]
MVEAYAPPHGSITPVIIVGAGPVGLLLALRLAQSNIRSIVLEQDTTLGAAPRAIGYYGPVHNVFKEAGIYDQVAREGMPSGGYVWRTLPTEDQTGTKALGSVLCRNIMSRPDSDGQYKICTYSIQLAQCRLAEIMLEELTKTGLSDVLWGHRVTDLSQDESGVTVTAVSGEREPKSFQGLYLAGCDGGKSNIRKLLGIRLAGHSWPERFIATDVLRTAPVVEDPPVHFTVDPRYWGVVTPLEHVEPGVKGLWRYSMAVPAYEEAEDGSRIFLTDEEVVEPKYVNSLLLRQIDGPRPSDHVVVRKSLYKMHQLLASTMHRGRCFLAGDAAHINNPIGGLGLCTGLLDADALHQALEIVRRTIDPQTLFSRYSSERRRVFQNIIHPYSSANKTRLHGADPEDTAREDWYFQALRKGDPKELASINAPLYNNWRSDMWSLIGTSLKGI